MSPRVEVGLHLHRADGVDPRRMVILTRHAEKLGYRSVWLGDHWVATEIVLGKYPYDPAQQPRHTFDSVWSHSLATLAYLAPATSTIPPGTSVIPTTHRHPL